MISSHTKKKLKDSENVNNKKPNVYLAGPDVFYPEPIEEGKKKKQLVREYGMIPHYPFDNEIEDFKNDRKTGLLIGKLNEGFMDKCQIILANMEKWHGPSMDVGTAFEVGYMSRKATEDPKNILIIGYYNHGEKKLFAERVVDEHYKGDVKKLKNGQIIGSDGMTVENFGLEDNLMINTAIEKTGGVICQSFKEAVQMASKLYKQKMSNSLDTEENVSTEDNFQFKPLKPDTFDF